MKSVNTSLEEICMIKENNDTSLQPNIDLFTNPVVCDSKSCENCNTNLVERSVSFSKLAERRHEKIMSRVINERAQVLKNHYCNPIIMTSNGCEHALPTCDPFHYICNGGDNGELDKNLRAHLEWTCIHEAKRQNIGCENLSFRDWYKVRFGDTVINEQVIKRFQRDYDYYRSSLSCDEGDKNLPHKLYSAETGDCSQNIPTDKFSRQFKIDCTNPEKGPKRRDYSSDDPLERSFEEFKSEFEKEVLQLLDEYKLKIRIKGYMLQDMWEKCERTFKKGRKF